MPRPAGLIWSINIRESPKMDCGKCVLIFDRSQRRNRTKTLGVGQKGKLKRNAFPPQTKVIVGRGFSAFHPLRPQHRRSEPESPFSDRSTSSLGLSQASQSHFEGKPGSPPSM